jgi:hypothetical protein
VSRAPCRDRLGRTLSVVGNGPRRSWAERCEQEGLVVNIRARLAKLERDHPSGDCPYPNRVTCVLEPGEPVPADALRCRFCGLPHVQVVVEEVVEEQHTGGPQ